VIVAQLVNRLFNHRKPHVLNRNGCQHRADVGQRGLHSVLPVAQCFNVMAQHAEIRADGIERANADCQK
jgi:hypothetical protein